MKLRLPQPPPEGVALHWLADYPQFAEGLAAIHHQEWSALMPDWSLDEAVLELLDHSTRRTFPTTLIALHEGKPIGSVSLVEQDAAQFADHKPWLCSFWVAPVWRGQGVGEALLTRLCFAAKRWGFGEVWLFTEGVTSLYERCGFALQERRSLFETEVQLLRADLRP
jgi:GNAT superfamily N-acetyltransferase